MSKRTRQRVPYVKFTARFHRHPKRELTLLGCAADGVLARACSYAREHETDGFVPGWFVDDQVKESPRHRRQLVAELLKPRPPHGRPLFEEAEGGYLIHDYLDVNESAEEIRERRGKERTRKRGQRLGGRQTSLEDHSPDPGVPRNVPRDTVGSGNKEVPLTTEDGGESHPRGLAGTVEQVLAILRTVPRDDWHVDDVNTRIGVENALCAHPNRDPIAAAHLTVTAASDPAWNTTSPQRAFGIILGRQPERQAGEVRVRTQGAYQRGDRCPGCKRELAPNEQRSQNGRCIPCRDKLEAELTGEAT